MIAELRDIPVAVYLGATIGFRNPEFADWPKKIGFWQKRSRL
ncbi:MAG: hypothetical protein QUV08_01370 [Parasphingorhabdus sp.]|jgi:hypothetical protein|nr:hypothetical protein [Parasphingorhabdus sp.]|tara:strand:+ start:722 stop:847 length:126 start_codon:yes stop_codon:yes gene_type:complete